MPTSELFDQHLMAEFREIRHVGPALQRSLNSKAGLSKTDIPKTYTLNKGHVKFFYDKGIYLYNRFDKIREELIKRGFNINLDTKFDIKLFPKEYRNDYTPTDSEIAINVQRIEQRISEKPNFYKKTGYVDE